MQSSHVFTNMTADIPRAEMFEGEEAQEHLFSLHTHK